MGKAKVEQIMRAAKYIRPTSVKLLIKQRKPASQESLIYVSPKKISG